VVHVHRQIAGKLTGPVTKWIVLVVVLLAAGGMGSFAGKLFEVQDNEMSSWLPESAESTLAIDKLGAFQDTEDVGTTVVYENPDGLTDDQLAAIEDDATQIEAINGVSQVMTPVRAAGAGIPAPYISDDGTVAKLDFTISRGDEVWLEMPDVADQVREIAGDHGTEVYFAGAGGTIADQSSAFNGFEGKLLAITLIVVIAILLGSYRSPILWALPIFSAVVGLGIAMGLLYFLAKYAGLTVNGQTYFIMMVLVIGAGTDYALLLVARYREELRRHEDRHEAMAFALHRAAPAIFASAGTVVIGLLCMTLAELNSTAGLGPANAIAIAVTFAVMVTLLPALLVICGRWVFWPFVPHFGSREPTTSGLWARVGNAIAPRPRVVWIGTALVLGALCLGIVKLDASGIPSDEQYPDKAESVLGQELMVKHGLLDASQPVQVLARADQASAVAEAMTGIAGIGAPSEPIIKGNTALILANIQGDPIAQSSYDAVEELRDRVHAVPDADALVTGWTAINIDTMEASDRDSRLIIPVVLLAVMLILMALLRALVAPIVLILTVILSFAAALGVSGVVFDLFFDRPHVDPGFPLFAFVFLVALGIDYNIFLMTRVREETAAHGTRKGSLIALSSTGGVITSAGLVLAATFTVLATMPVTFALQIGATIALGVLLDTMIVRSVLVTALNLDLGSRIWWPSKLDGGGRSLPESGGEPEQELVSAL